MQSVTDTMPPMDNPAIAAWGLSLSDSDFAKLKHGLLAQNMDDKWAFLAMTDEELSAGEAEEKIMEGEAMDTVLTIPDEDLTEEQLLERQVHELEEIERDELEREQRAADREAAVNLNEGSNICIFRAWSEKEFYRLIIEPKSKVNSGTNTAQIKAITWEQNQGDFISEEQAKIDIILLCRSQLDCEIAAAPDYDPVLYSGFPRSWVIHGGPIAPNSTIESSEEGG